MTHVMVFVPGLLGSELFDNQGKVWPGSLVNGILGFSDSHFQRLLEPNLQVGGIIEKAAGVVDIYGKWIDAFRRLRVAGKQLFNENATPKTLYKAPYDWRIDLAVSATDRLAPIIDKAVSDHGANVEIHLVAHSLGGLVSRYYLQSGKFNNRPGFGKIKTFITFGTPHNGAPVALAGALGLHKTNFMSIAQSKQLCNDPRYPALYQTFPLGDAPIFWDRSTQGKLVSKTLKDAQFTTDVLKLNASNLAKTFELHTAIDLQKNPLPAAIRTFLLVGTRFETITHFEWRGTTVDKIETPDGGDGTVSIQGAYIPGMQVQLTGEAHTDLIKSGVAKSAFQRLFGGDGLLAPPEAGRIILSLRDPDVMVNDPVYLLLKMEGDVAAFTGRLVWERAKLKPGAEEFAEDDFAPTANPPPKPVEYRGPDAETMMLKLTAPNVTGIYRIVLKRDGKPDERTSALVVRA